MYQIPALCFGQKYQSLSVHKVADLGSGEALASLSLVLESMIATHCLREGRLEKAFQTLQSIPVRERIRMSVLAADHFENATLPCGEDTQTPAQYIEVLSRTSGLSHTLARANTGRICKALRDTELIMNGLTRGLPLDTFDTGIGQQGGATVRITPRIKALGANMPNNSPGVNVIWIISLAFGIPVLIRPGSSEPFTPFRLIQAFIKAGFPPEVFGYYPCDYNAANRIPLLTKGAIVFGSDETVQRWATHPLVQVHGSGFSKLFVGDDIIDNWKELVPELARNVSANSGRSCFAVSTIVVPKYGREIADAIAAELSKLKPAPLDDQNNLLSAIAMPETAKYADQTITNGIDAGGAVDMSAPYRDGERLVKYEGRTYLHPTIIYCDSMGHTLAQQEFLFPYAAVVQATNDEAFANMGPTLALAVYTQDPNLVAKASRSFVSLVSANKPTSELDRSQPHEEDLFQLLYNRGSFTKG